MLHHWLVAWTWTRSAVLGARASALARCTGSTGCALRFMKARGVSAICAFLAAIVRRAGVVLHASGSLHSKCQGCGRGGSCPSPSRRGCASHSWPKTFAAMKCGFRAPRPSLLHELRQRSRFLAQLAAEVLGGRHAAHQGDGRRAGRGRQRLPRLEASRMVWSIA